MRAELARRRARVVAAHLRDVQDLLEGVPAGLAVLELDQVEHFVLAVEDEIREAEQHLGPVGGGPPRPVALRSPRGVRGGRHVLGRAARDLPEEAAGRRHLHLGRLPRPCRRGTGGQPVEQVAGDPRAEQPRVDAGRAALRSRHAYPLAARLRAAATPSKPCPRLAGKPRIAARAGSAAWWAVRGRGQLQTHPWGPPPPPGRPAPARGRRGRMGSRGGRRCRRRRRCCTTRSGQRCWRRWNGVPVDPAAERELPAAGPARPAHRQGSDRAPRWGPGVPGLPPGRRRGGHRHRRDRAGDRTQPRTGCGVTPVKGQPGRVLCAKRPTTAATREAMGAWEGRRSWRRRRPQEDSHGPTRMDLAMVTAAAGRGRRHHGAHRHASRARPDPARSR